MSTPPARSLILPLVFASVFALGALVRGSLVEHTEPLRPEPPEGKRLLAPGPDAVYLRAGQGVVYYTTAAASTPTTPIPNAARFDDMGREVEEPPVFGTSCHLPGEEPAPERALCGSGACSERGPWDCPHLKGELRSAQ